MAAAGSGVGCPTSRPASMRASSTTSTWLATGTSLASLFPPASFDVVVWDPPHVSDAGSGIVGHGDWGDRYGTLTPGLKGRTITPLFVPFLEAARAVLQPSTGIVLAKIADQVHSGERQWQFIDLPLASRAAGFT